MGIASLSPISKKPPNKRLFLLQPIYRVCYTGTMETARHNLYIPLELYEKLKFLAEKDLRTFNKECIFLLGQMVEHRRGDLIDFQQENKSDGKET